MDHRRIYQTTNVTEMYSVRHEHDEWKSGEEFEYKYNRDKKDFRFPPNNWCLDINYYVSTFN
jgi:hypothetical protein